jgi:hypothetical protein
MYHNNPDGTIYYTLHPLDETGNGIRSNNVYPDDFKTAIQDIILAYKDDFMTRVKPNLPSDAKTSEELNWKQTLADPNYKPVSFEPIPTE